MIFRELTNAAFLFSLRRPGAEIMGGGRSNAPPPSRRWKIQRPSRARVKKFEKINKPINPGLLPHATYTDFAQSGKTIGSGNVTRISFIFEATPSISWLQNYASQLQPDYENAPQTSRIEGGSGRLVGALPPPVRGSGRVGMRARTLSN